MINLEDEWWNQAIELFSWWAWRGTLHPSGDKIGLFKMLKKKKNRCTLYCDCNYVNKCIKEMLAKKVPK